MTWTRYLWLTADGAALLSLLLAPAVMIFPAFFFDDPKSVGSPFPYIMTFIVWVYPITAGLGGYRGVRAYRAGDFAQMRKWTVCAYSSPLLFVIVMFIAAFGDLFRSPY